MTRRICGAKTRAGHPCKCIALYPNGRCRVHGGATPRGPAAGAWKHGRYSLAMKDLGLREMYERARVDPTLTDLREEIALVQTRLQTLVSQTSSKKAEDVEQNWEAMLDLIEQQRKLVESLQKHEHRPELSVPIEQVFAYTRRVVALVMNTFADKQEIARFLDGLRQLVGRARDIDVIATPPTD